MRHTKYATELPTRTTLRRTAVRAVVAAGEYAALAAVASVAALTFAAGSMALGFALAVALRTLPAHPATLLAAAAIATAAVNAVPLLAVLAGRAAARTLDRRA